MDTIHLGTAQQVFETVQNHLITQNEKSVDGVRETRCKYRSSNGLKCAIGCLIPDEEYKKQYENASVGSLYESHILKFTIMDMDDDQTLHFLSQLQDIHDVSIPDKWEHRLEIFKKNWSEENVL